MFSSTWFKYSPLIVAVWLLINGRTALACPLCFASSNARVLNAFYLTTGLLILLPLFAIGFVTFTLIHYGKRHDPS
jgi:hypothetical protein